MERGEWIAHALAAAKTHGCSDAEVFCAQQDAFSVSALNGQIDRYSVSKKGGVSVRAQFHGRDGYAYTECLDAPEAAVARALDNARCLETDAVHPMQTPQPCRTVVRPASPLDKMSVEQKIELALALEQKTLAMDKRVE